MRFQIYQSYSLKALGPMSGKNSINWISVGTEILKVTLKLRLQTSKFIQRVHIEVTV